MILENVCSRYKPYKRLSWVSAVYVSASVLQSFKNNVCKTGIGRRRPFTVASQHCKLNTESYLVRQTCSYTKKAHTAYPWFNAQLNQVLYCIDRSSGLQLHFCTSFNFCSTFTDNYILQCTNHSSRMQFNACAICDICTTLVGKLRTVLHKLLFRRTVKFLYELQFMEWICS